MYTIFFLCLICLSFSVLFCFQMTTSYIHTTATQHTKNVSIVTRVLEYGYLEHGFSYVKLSYILYTRQSSESVQIRQHCVRRTIHDIPPFPRYAATVLRFKNERADHYTTRTPICICPVRYYSNYIIFVSLAIVVKIVF